MGPCYQTKTGRSCLSSGRGGGELKPWTRGYKTFFMLTSAETKIYPAHKCLFMSRINYQILSFEPEFSTNFDYFSIYEQLKFHAQLS